MNFEILSVISHIAAVAVLELLLFLFYRNIYRCRYNKKIYYISGFIISVILMECVNKIGVPILNMFYSFASEFAVCIILFESNIKKIWFHNLLLWVILSIADVITVLIPLVISGGTVGNVLADEQGMFIGNISYIILMIAGYKIYMIFMQKINFKGIQFKTAAFVIIMNFFDFWIIISFGEKITDRADGIKMIAMLLAFLLINLFFVYVLNRLSEAYRYKYELSLSERLNEMYLSNYTEMSHKYEQSRALIHDIKKHLMVANELDNKETKNQYLSDVYKRIDELFGGFKCSNKILSVAVSQKMSYARSKGIEVAISAEDVPIDFVDDLDITAIFANLWDNAIEACDKVTDKKYIEMSMSRVNDFILINLENSYNGVIKTENKNLISTKPNHSGVGLKSVKYSVEKYDGVFITNYNDKTFRAEITLPII